jgi:hypothetical protein
MNPEQKKEYMAPIMNVVQVHCQNRLMQVSEEEKEPFESTEETTGELS